MYQFLSSYLSSHNSCDDVEDGADKNESDTNSNEGQFRQLDDWRCPFLKGKINEERDAITSTTFLIFTSNS